MHIDSEQHDLVSCVVFSQGGGAVTRPPAERLHSGSNPDLGFDVAATAIGKLPFPSRTRKISLSTFHTVLKCESLWELWIAATSLKLTFCVECFPNYVERLYTRLKEILDYVTIDSI